MVRTFERWREIIIEHASTRINNADNSRLIDLITDFCKSRGIPATDQDIQDIVSEAIRRRMVEKFKELIADINQLKARVTALENAIQTGIDRYDTLKQQVIALNQKVDSFHP